MESRASSASAARWVLLLASLLLIVAARCWNREQIFVDRDVYFVDADCYSRMTRVKMVAEDPGLILRQHDFENWPQGTTPHTTAPLDYLIAGVFWTLRPFVPHALDLAGAITPLLLAAATGMVLWKWAGRFRFSTQCAVLLLFAVSPILVHGTVLGRPDHQALLIFLISAALATEWALLAGSEHRWTAFLNGTAWGLALWTSLFEPLLLWVILTAGGWLSLRQKWWNPQRRKALLLSSLILLSALLIEHWRIAPIPDRELFARWSRSIGELATPGLFAPLFLSWLGLLFPAALLLLPWRVWREKNRAILPWLLLLLSTWLLSAWLVRWGYFLALAFLFCLPPLLEKWRSRWWIGVFVLTLWSVAGDWDQRLFPDEQAQAQLAEQQEDYRELRQMSTNLTAGDGFLAPWWLSPPLAYWSGANGVAGSSHQSLPGIRDTAEFYLSVFPEKARALLKRRRVRWIVAYEPDRVLGTSSLLLDAPPARAALGATLYDTPRLAPAFLRLRAETAFFKLYEWTAGSQ